MNLFQRAQNNRQFILPLLSPQEFNYPNWLRPVSARGTAISGTTSLLKLLCI
ncbi:MAG TPA: hypothetical protein V6C90_07955 [Coleofasciculaceae cyanobacterium]